MVRCRPAAIVSKGLRSTLATASAVVSLLMLPAMPAAAQDVVLVGGRLFDSVGDRLRDNPGIAIVNGRISAIGIDPQATQTASQVITLTDEETVLPGLIDLHAHYNVTLNEIRREETRILPLIYLANGVTSTFPAGSLNPEAMLEARRRIDRGEQSGPRIFNSGPYFGPARPGWNRDVTTAEIYAEVDRWAESGVRGFKAKRISARHLQPLIERAHQHGLTVTAHLDSGYGDTVNPREAILMGIDRVEHFLGGDVLAADRPAYDSLADANPSTPEFKRIAELFLKHQVYFDATLSAYGYYGPRDEVFEQWTDERAYLTPFTRELTADRRQWIEKFGKIYRVKLRTVKAFYDLGGGHLITLGTDHPSTGEYLAGFAAHRELHAMVQAGLPPAAALKAGTINGARALGLGDQLGSIEVGKWADLIVISGDPLAEIRNTRNVRVVLKGGTRFDPRELLGGARDRLGPVDAADALNW